MSPLEATGQPKHASYHTRVAEKPADAPAVVATKGVRARWHAYASGTAPTVWLPINHRGPQEPDQAPQAVFKAQVARAQGQQQAAQLVQLPALLALGGGGQGLLQRLVDGVQGRIHGLVDDQTVESPAISSRHLVAHLPQSCVQQHGLMMEPSVTGDAADVWIVIRATLDGISLWARYDPGGVLAPGS